MCALGQIGFHNILEDLLGGGLDMSDACLTARAFSIKILSFSVLLVFSRVRWCPCSVCK